MSPRNSVAEAQRTKDRILQRAVDSASSLGLEGLTIGSLASDAGMSRAGVIGPFGSREKLLAATLENAVDVFRQAVVVPLVDLPPGVPRLERLIEVWVRYLVDGPFPGGCFVTATSFELDGRPGALRERLRTIVTTWRDFLTSEVSAAQLGMQMPRQPAEEVVTTLVGISMAINQEVQLLADPSAARRGAQAMRHALSLD